MRECVSAEVRWPSRESSALPHSRTSALAVSHSRTSALSSSGPGRRCGTAARPGSRERIGDEALRRQPRPAQVPARHRHAADEQLAGHADGHRLAGAVQDVDRASCGSAGRWRRAPRRGAARPRGHLAAPRWARTGWRAPPPGAAGGTAAPAPRRPPRRSPAPLTRPVQRPASGCSRKSCSIEGTKCAVVIALAADRRGQVAPGRGARPGAPAPAGRPPSAARRTPRTRRRRRTASSAAAPRRAPARTGRWHPREPVHQAPVLQHHPLGPPGGAGGEDHVRQVPRRQPAAAGVRRRTVLPTPRRRRGRPPGWRTPPTARRRWRPAADASAGRRGRCPRACRAAAPPGSWRRAGRRRRRP